MSIKTKEKKYSELSIIYTNYFFCTIIEIKIYLIIKFTIKEIKSNFHKNIINKDAKTKNLIIGYNIYPEEFFSNLSSSNEV